MLGIKKLSNVIILPLATIFLISQGVFISDAYAYLDPGSGSIIAQAIIAALVGVGITVKLYWVKLKFKLSSTFSRK